MTAPGSAHTDKSEGWTLHHFNNTFAIYTYAYDVSGISNIKVRGRAHTNKSTDPLDNTHKVYDPAALKAACVPNTDNGLSAGTTYSYTVKARDAVGNTSAASSALSVTTRPPDTTAPSAPTGLTASGVTNSSATLSWAAATDNDGVAGYYVFRNGTQIAAPSGMSHTDSSLSPSTTYSYTVKAVDAAGNLSAASSALSVTMGAGNTSTVYYKKGFATPYIHYRPAGGTWTTPPRSSFPGCLLASRTRRPRGVDQDVDLCFAHVEHRDRPERHRRLQRVPRRHARWLAFHDQLHGYRPHCWHDL